MSDARLSTSGRFRYSLRALLVLTVVIALIFAWVHQARRQQVAVELLRESNPGARVFYDVRCAAPGVVGPQSDSPAQRWARELFGVDYGATVVMVQLSYPTDADMACLPRLPNLQSVVLHRSIDLTDEGLAYLLRLKHLRTLVIYDAEQLTDDGLQRLTALQSLETLRINLGRFRVRRETLELLRGALPNCKIEAGKGQQTLPELAQLTVGH